MTRDVPARKEHRQIVDFLGCQSQTIILRHCRSCIAREPHELGLPEQMENSSTIEQLDGEIVLIAHNPRPLLAVLRGDGCGSLTRQPSRVENGLLGLPLGMTARVIRE